MELTGSVKDAKIPGWKRKTSKREDRVMVRKSKSNRFKTTLRCTLHQAEMQIEHCVSILVSTTRRRLKRGRRLREEEGLEMKKPRLNCLQLEVPLTVCTITQRLDS